MSNVAATNPPHPRESRPTAGVKREGGLKRELFISVVSRGGKMLAETRRDHSRLEDKSSIELAVSFSEQLFGCA
jgi:hypothetical protein